MKELVKRIAILVPVGILSALGLSALIAKIWLWFAVPLGAPVAPVRNVFGLLAIFSILRTPLTGLLTLREKALTIQETLGLTISCWITYLMTFGIAYAVHAMGPW